MSLTLQPSVTTLPLDGLPVQSHDAAVSQSPSFGEVLKVEEKKLQQEQEASALAMTAMHTTIQLPFVTEPSLGLIVSAESPSTESTAQPALTTDSSQSANPSPQQNLPTTPVVEAFHPVKTQPVDRVSSMTSSGSAMIGDLQARPTNTYPSGQATEPAAETSQPTKAQPVGQASSLTPSESKQLGGLQTASPAPVFKLTPAVDSKLIQISQSNEPITPEPRPVSKFSILTAKLTSPNHIQQGQDRPVILNNEITTGSKSAVENVSTSDVPQPVKSTVAPSAKAVVANVPVQADVAANDVPQPVKSIIAPSAKPAVVENAPVQVDASASHVSQPVKATVTPSAKAVVENRPALADAPASENSQPVKTTVAPSAKVIVENALGKADVVASEMPQPVKETVVPNVKPVVENAPVQVDASASQVPQPVKATVAPSAKVVVENASVQTEVVVSEVPQPVKATVAPSAESCR